MNHKIGARKVAFNKAQVELIKQSFPPQQITPASKIEDIMFEAGRQQVINFVASLVAEDEVMYV